MKRLLLILLATIGGADTYTWVSLLLVPITGVASWFAGRRARNNDTMQKMQDTINMLAGKNEELYKKIVEQNAQIMELNNKLNTVSQENAELKDGQERMIEQLTVVQRENAGLKRQLESIKKGQTTTTKK